MLKISIAISFMLFSNLAFAVAANSGKMNVTSIESRSSGNHDVFFSAAVPTQGCSIENRALLNEQSTGGRTMLSILLSSLVSGKQVIVRVDGCLDSRPNIIKVKIHQ